MMKNTTATVRAEAKPFRFQLMVAGFREDTMNHGRMLAPEGMNSRVARSLAHKIFWESIKLNGAVNTEVFHNAKKNKPAYSRRIIIFLPYCGKSPY